MHICFVLNPITLKEAVEQIETGQWLHIKFLTADVDKGTGGKLLELPKARLCKNRLNAKSGTWHGVTEGKLKKYPNHNLHFTRNLELPNKQIRKLHPILILSINNHPVL